MFFESSILERCSHPLPSNTRTASSLHLSLLFSAYLCVFFFVLCDFFALPFKLLMPDFIGIAEWGISFRILESPQTPSNPLKYFLAPFTSLLPKSSSSSPFFLSVLYLHWVFLTKPTPPKYRPPLHLCSKVPPSFLTPHLIMQAFELCMP